MEVWNQDQNQASRDLQTQPTLRRLLRKLMVDMGHQQDLSPRSLI